MSGCAPGSGEASPCSTFYEDGHALGTEADRQGSRPPASFASGGRRRTVDDVEAAGPDSGGSGSLQAVCLVVSERRYRKVLGHACGSSMGESAQSLAKTRVASSKLRENQLLKPGVCCVTGLAGDRCRNTLLAL